MGLIIRGVAFEFRSKDENPLWRKLWDWCIFTGSLIPAILLPVAFANLLRGIPIDAAMQYTGGFFNLLNPYALLAALTFTLLVLFHGASFLSLKTTGEIEQKAKELQRWLWLLVVLMLIIFLVTSFIATGVLDRLNALMVIFPLGCVIAIVAAGFFMNKKQFGLVFFMTCLTTGFFVATIFGMLYPNVIVSSLNPDWSLTIQNAASSPYTLRLMTIITLIFLPIVLAYQGWAYWVFRKRVTGEPKNLTY
jgi:cytochrome d ubiquinol oxidase subunit II